MRCDADRPSLSLRGNAQTGKCIRQIPPFIAFRLHVAFAQDLLFCAIRKLLMEIATISGIDTAVLGMFLSKDNGVTARTMPQYLFTGPGRIWMYVWAVYLV